MKTEKCLKAFGTSRGIVRLYVSKDVTKTYIVRLYKREDGQNCKLDLECVKTNFTEATETFSHYKTYISK